MTIRRGSLATELDSILQWLLDSQWSGVNITGDEGYCPDCGCWGGAGLPWQKGMGHSSLCPRVKAIRTLGGVTISNGL